MQNNSKTTVLIKNYLTKNLTKTTIAKIKSIHHYILILRMLTLQEFRNKYSKFRLGILWTLLEPVSMAVLLWLVFAVFLKSRDFGLRPYLLFLTLGIIPWWWFSTAVNGSAKIIKKTKPTSEQTYYPHISGFCGQT